eukprot:TRINITY_DN1424_c0_g1_i5.p1 TRINITY_DN1424_c0_g1~~TRINITY_DN1424_c0_g1_i5.p1  ORF type:complete len:735 (+),score=260.72 TRINITY_DN1424_c0_g1_i5:80-2284(+)
MRAVIVPAAVLALSGSALGSDAPKAEDKQAAPTDAQKSQQSSGADDYYKNYLAKYENSKAAGPDESTKSSKDNAYSNSYAQYMKQSGGQGGQSSNGGAGGYDKYYKQYTQQKSGGQGGDSSGAGGASGYDKYYKQYQTYYQKYTQKKPAQGKEKKEKAASDEKPKAQAEKSEHSEHRHADEMYVPKPAAQPDAASLLATLETDSDATQSDPKVMRDQFMQQYAAGYVPPKQEHNSPMDPTECKTVDQLKAWRAAKVWSIKQYVPTSYQGQSEKNIQADYKTNMLRLQREAEAEAAAAAKAASSTEDKVEPTAVEGAANLVAASPEQQDMIKQYVPSEVNVKNSTETAGNYQKTYVDEYMSGSMTRGSTGGDAMESDPAQMRDHFMKQYASGYVPPKQQTNTPMAAEDCKSVDELKAWKAAKVWSIKKYVPESYQGQSVKNIQADFKTNMLRLQHESEAKAAAAGAALETEDKAAPAKTEEGPANLAAVAVDQQNMMKQYVPSEVNVQNTQETASNYQKKYVDEYTANMKATGDAGGDAMESNPTQMRDHFMKQYASGYVPPKQENNTPMAPEDCKTVDELKAWKAAKVWSIKKYVPKSYAGQSEKSIEADFQTNMERLQREAEAKAAAAKAAAAAAKSKAAAEKKESESLRGSSSADSKHDDASSETADSPKKHVEDAKPDAEPVEAVGLAEEAPGASVPLLFAIAALPMLAVTAFLHKFSKPERRQLDQPFLG